MFLNFELMCFAKHMSIPTCDWWKKTKIHQTMNIKLPIKTVIPTCFVFVLFWLLAITPITKKQKCYITLPDNLPVFSSYIFFISLLFQTVCFTHKLRQKLYTIFCALIRDVKKTHYMPKTPKVRRIDRY